MQKSPFDKTEIKFSSHRGVFLRVFFYVFGLQLNIFMSVGILVKYFRCKVLKFK